MHQPLHVGQNDDRGGNEVTIATFEGGRARNLHAFWDGDLVTATIGSQREQVAEIDALIAAREASWTDRSIEDWGREAHAYSRDYAYARLEHPPECGEAPADGGTITPAYVEGGRPIVRQQLAKAIVRLAESIERAAGGGSRLSAQ